MVLVLESAEHVIRRSMAVVLPPAVLPLQSLVPAVNVLESEVSSPGQVPQMLVLLRLQLWYPVDGKLHQRRRTMEGFDRHQLPVHLQHLLS